MARDAKLVLILISAVALALLASSSAAAATSRFTFTLTLHGTVRPDVGFELSLSPGFGGSNIFCVAAGDPFLDVAPRCESGRTYTTVVDLAPGESIDYSLNLLHPRSLRVLWSGTLTGDGRNHRRSYGFDFDLPATDAMAPSASAAPSAIDLVPQSLPVLVIAFAAGYSAWYAVSRRRGPPVRS